MILNRIQILWNWRLCLPKLWEWPLDWEDKGMKEPIFKSLDLGIIEIRLLRKVTDAGFSWLQRSGKWN